MGRLDRREKLALDEAYRYCRALDRAEEQPHLYKLARCLKTVSAALTVTDAEQFKLTKQLWRRIHMSLFDKMISGFSGYAVVTNGDGHPVLPTSTFPDEGLVEFHPEGCRRADDIFAMEIRGLYPATQINLARVWESRGAATRPDDFMHAECGPEGCLLKPVVFGHEILGEESIKGKERAYHQWWDLYWQAYCSKDKHDQHSIFRRMDDLEQVWGNLYY